MKITQMQNKYVCIINKTLKSYLAPPFNPSEIYPELFSIKHIHVGEENAIYTCVRNCLVKLGYDKGNVGTPNWNPLQELVKPGNRVLIKPNFVLHFNKNSNDISAVVTQAAILRPIIDYVWKALSGTGEIIIGDAPHGNADFSAIVNNNGTAELVDYLKESGVNIQLIDFRKFVYPSGPSGFEKGIYLDQAGDPSGYVMVDLKDKSFLEKLENLHLLYGSDYNRKSIVDNHSNGHHKYLVSASVLNADVVISVPKMKVHKKTGVTLNLKNLVGINGDKNYLAHYRIGSPSQGGDEYPDIFNPYWKIRFKIDRMLCDLFMAPNKTSLRMLNAKISFLLSVLDRLLRFAVGKPRKYRNGDWIGNDTTWRMVLDLYQILLYSDSKGTMHSTPQRKVFSVIDGIIAGEGDGPMEPDNKYVGAVICGEDPVITDAITSYIMGFDIQKLPIISESLKNFCGTTLDELPSQYASVEINGQSTDFRQVNLKFVPHPEWLSSIRK